MYTVSFYDLTEFYFPSHFYIMYLILYLNSDTEKKVQSCPPNFNTPCCSVLGNSDKCELPRTEQQGVLTRHLVDMGEFQVEIHPWSFYISETHDTAKFVDMLSAIGGTMGLLTGFSIISAVEMIYFAAKIMWNFLQKNKKT